MSECYKREQFAVLWKYMVLECTTPAWDLRSHVRVVVADFPNCSTECPKMLQSTPPLWHLCCGSTWMPEPGGAIWPGTNTETFLTWRSTLVITRAAVSIEELQPKPWFIFWDVCECSVSSACLNLTQIIWDQSSCEMLLVPYCTRKTIVFSYRSDLHDFSFLTEGERRVQDRPICCLVNFILNPFLSHWHNKCMCMPCLTLKAGLVLAAWLAY